MTGNASALLANDRTTPSHKITPTNAAGTSNHNHNANASDPLAHAHAHAHHTHSAPQPFVPQFPTLKALLIYALRSFTKSFLIGYGIRSGFQVVLRIITLLRSSPRTLLNIDAVFGAGSTLARADAVRLGLFFGGFTGLFELTYSLLDRYRGPDDGWSAAIAGAVAGLSILCQRGDTHRTLGLYLFARVVQCVYNGLKARGKVSPLPHGDAALFSISSAVVMYCYVLRPEALPKSFYNFILRTGPISEVSLRVVRHTTYNVPFNTDAIKNFIRDKFASSPGYYSWFASSAAQTIPAAAVPAMVAAAMPTVPTVTHSLPTITNAVHAATAAATAAAAALPAAAAPGAATKLDSVYAWLWSVLQSKRAAAKLRLAAAAQAQTTKAIANSAASAASAAAAAVGAAAATASGLKGVLDMDVKLAAPLVDKSVAAAAASTANAGAAAALTGEGKAALREALIHQMFGTGGVSTAEAAAAAAAAAAATATAATAATATAAVAATAAGATATAAAATAASAATKAASKAAATALSPYAMPTVTTAAVSAAKRRAEALVFAPQPGYARCLSTSLALSGTTQATAVADSCGGSFAKLPCLGLHPQVPHSCAANGARVFHTTVEKILPLYSSLTVVPLVLFKNVKLLRDPLKYLLEASGSILRSCFFLGSFTSVYQWCICAHRNATPFGGKESKAVIFGAGLVCGFVSILFERKSRRSELALYVLPRAVDALLYILREKRLLPGPALGSFAVENVWVWCAAMGALSYYFIHEPQHVSGLVYTVMKYLFGRDPAAMRACKAALQQQQSKNNSNNNSNNSNSTQANSAVGLTSDGALRKDHGDNAVNGNALVDATGVAPVAVKV